MTTHDKIIFLLEFFYDNSRLPCINDTEIDGINLYEFMQDIEMCEIILEDNDRKAVEDIGIKIKEGDTPMLVCEMVIDAINKKIQI